jgi:hypothetical protein
MKLTIGGHSDARGVAKIAMADITYRFRSCTGKLIDAMRDDH